MIDDYGAARFYFDVVVAVGVVLNTGYTWAANRTKGNKVAIEQVRQQVVHLESRFSTLESQVQHLPGRADVEELHDRITEVANLVSETRGELRGINRTLENIHQSLLAERTK